MAHIDIQPKHLEQVLQILSQHIPEDTNVFAFGSRVTGKARPYSDLDLALVFSDGFTDSKNIINQLSIAFEASSIPFPVDVLDLDNIDQTFKTLITNEMVDLLNYTEKNK